MLVSFLGDIALNGVYINFQREKINPFIEVEPILSQSDYVIGNLECMAHGNQGENIKKKPRLSTTIETLNLLTSMNLSVACLGNNHVYDHLEDGFQQTSTFLSKHSILTIGAGSSKEEAAKHLILAKDGVKVGFMNYLTADTNPSIPDEAIVKVNDFNWESFYHDVMQLKSQVDQLVLLFHWGGLMEGSMYPHKEQIKIARKIIDSGVDLIIGHHSHTLQPYEIYGGKYVFYSLGNFCFSDFLFEGKVKELIKSRSNNSAIVNVNFQKSSYEVSVSGIYNSAGYIKVFKEPDKKVIKNLSKNVELLYWQPFWNLFLLWEKKVFPVYSYFFENGRNPFRQLIKIKWTRLIKKYLK